MIGRLSVWAFPHTTPFQFSMSHGWMCLIANDDDDEALRPLVSDKGQPGVFGERAGRCADICVGQVRRVEHDVRWE